MKKLFQELENAMNSNTKAVLINNPNNPSGAVYPEQENAMTRFQLKVNPYALAVDYRVSLTYKFPCQYNN
jgi:histidinol-phosphate/aromatic aminotransferase/cobyric acid decarboxylase-like protein